jgi:hypothetical protein
MGKVRPGNKQNAGLNGEWAAHVRRWGKRMTAGLRRAKDKQETHEARKNNDADDDMN